MDVYGNERDVPRPRLCKCVLVERPFKEVLADSVALQSKIEGQIEGYEQQKVKVNEINDQCQDAVDREFDNYIREINQRREQLKNKCDDMARKKLALLQQEIEGRLEYQKEILDAHNEAQHRIDTEPENVVRRRQVVQMLEIAMHEFMDGKNINEQFTIECATKRLITKMRDFGRVTEKRKKKNRVFNASRLENDDEKSNGNLAPHGHGHGFGGGRFMSANDLGSELSQRDHDAMMSDGNMVINYLVPVENNVRKMVVSSDNKVDEMKRKFLQRHGKTPKLGFVGKSTSDLVISICDRSTNLSTHLLLNDDDFPVYFSGNYYVKFMLVPMTIPYHLAADVDQIYKWKLTMDKQPLLETFCNVMRKRYRIDTSDENMIIELYDRDNNKTITRITNDAGFFNCQSKSHAVRLCTVDRADLDEEAANYFQTVPEIGNVNTIRILSASNNSENIEWVEKFNEYYRKKMNADIVRPADDDNIVVALVINKSPQAICEMNDEKDLTFYDHNDNVIFNVNNTRQAPIADTIFNQNCAAIVM